MVVSSLDDDGLEGHFRAQRAENQFLSHRSGVTVISTIYLLGNPVCPCGIPGGAGVWEIVCFGSLTFDLKSFKLRTQTAAREIFPSS